ncbi:MAG: MBL fold metallo-hydrolase [Patescibacteria group bacterium]
MDKKSGNFRITFYGGVGTVTGANFMVEGAGKRFLVDCGLMQGCFKVCDDSNRAPFPYDPASIDAVFITHSHIDHVGRLPKLVKDGFRGVVYSTPPAKEIAELMLIDSLGVMEKEAERDNLPMIYGESDISEAMRLWKTALYKESIDMGGGITIRLLDSGHVLGSSMVEINHNKKKLIVTGDLGNSPSPLLNDPETIADADYLVTESVYGDRNHESHAERKRRLEEIIEREIMLKGVLMIPAFSLERSQEILFEINDFVENRKIPPVPIYFDSPLAIKVTKIYSKYHNYFNPDVRDLIKKGDDIFSFTGLKVTMTTEESKSIADAPNPKVIIAGSGMSQGGRIIHHEKRYLPDDKNTLLLIGYQSAGTPGRLLQEGVKSIKIMGEDVPINAEVITLSGYSAHKDSDALIDFISHTSDTVKKVFVVMGEVRSSLFLAQRLRDNLGIQSFVPSIGESFELDMG